MPTAIETTRICSTLNERPTEPSPLSWPSRPRTLAGTRPVRKSSHEPVVDGRRGRVGGDAGVVTRLEDQAEDDADDDRDECGDGEPRQRPPREAGSAGHFAQVGDRGDDREEDERRDDGAQQRDEGAAMVLSVSVSQLGSISPVVASTPSAPMLERRDRGRRRGPGRSGPGRRTRGASGAGWARWPRWWSSWRVWPFAAAGRQGRWYAVGSGSGTRGGQHRQRELWVRCRSTARRRVSRSPSVVVGVRTQDRTGSLCSFIPRGGGSHEPDHGGAGQVHRAGRVGVLPQATHEEDG